MKTSVALGVLLIDQGIKVDHQSDAAIDAPQRRRPYDAPRAAVGARGVCKVLGLSGR